MSEKGLLLENSNKISVEYNIPNGKKTFFNSSYSKLVIPTALISYGIIAGRNISIHFNFQSSKDIILTSLFLNSNHQKVAHGIQIYTVCKKSNIRKTVIRWPI